MGGERGGTGECGQGVGFSGPSGLSEVSEPVESAETAEVLEGGTGNARHHRLPAAGHAWRYRGNSGSYGIRRHTQGARGARLDRRGRSSRSTRPAGALLHVVDVSRRSESALVG